MPLSSGSQRTGLMQVMPVQPHPRQGCSALPSGSVSKRYPSARADARALLAPHRELDMVKDIDCVVPVPDGSRPAAIQISAHLGLPYREGLVKNRYVGRTFIMPDQQ